MAVKRCPSFSSRPGFPSGLRVLLVDADVSARRSTESLLRELSYQVRLLPLPGLQQLAAACMRVVKLMVHRGRSLCGPAAGQLGACLPAAAPPTSPACSAPSSSRCPPPPLHACSVGPGAAA